MQSLFHSHLIKYINLGCFSKSDYIFSLLNGSQIFKKNATKLIQLNKLEVDSEANITTDEIEVNLNYYQGKNSFVLKLSSLMQKELNNNLFGAYLHGSLATGEEIKYSDFDALIILKDSVFEDKKSLSTAALKLNRLIKIMHEFDPLQHHGWFVLTESMLKNYPVAYFPIELFKHSVSLLPLNGLSFDVSCDQNKTDFEAPFLQLSNELLKKLQHKYRPQNSFALKSFLSEFMLLPSFYLQSKNKEAVYKKNSFELAKKYFSDEEWNIMNQVSEIRKDWNYEISFFQRKLLCHRNTIVRKISRKFAPVIPNSTSEKLTDEFYTAMSILVLSMQANIKST